MKRKIFSKLLMGAFLIASISSFVSCKDYDDDIKKNTDAIGALQTTVNNLQSALDAAKAEANTAHAAFALKTQVASDIAAATKGLATEDAVAQVKKANEDAVAALAAEIKALATIDALEAAKKEAADALAKAMEGTATKEDLDKVSVAVSAIDSKLDGINTALAETNNNVKANADAIAAAQKNIETQQAAIAALQEALKGAGSSSAIDDLKGEVGKANQEISSVKGELAKAQADLAALRTALNSKGNQAAIDALDAKVKELEALKTELADLKSAVTKLQDLSEVKDLMKKADEKVDKVSTNINLLTVFVTKQLRGIVFQPNFYYGGIEAAEVPAIVYQPLTNAGVDFRYNKLGVAAAQNVAGTGRLNPSNANSGWLKQMTAANVGGWGIGCFTANPNQVLTTDILTNAVPTVNTFVTVLTPNTNVSYHMNPSNAGKENIKGVTAISDDKVYITRTAASNPRIVSWDVANGMLNAEVAVTYPQIAQNGAGTNVTVMATQVAYQGAQGDTIITSDYHALAPSLWSDLVIADKGAANVGQPACGIINYNARHTFDLARDAVSTPANQAPAGWPNNANFVANGAAHTINWNSNGVDLNSIFEIHGFHKIFNRNGAQAANGGALGQEYVITAAQLKQWGLELRYSLVEYTTGTELTEQTTTHAQLKGSTLVPYGINENQTNASIGRMPLVRIELYDTKNNALVKRGYSKWLITAERAKDVNIEMGNGTRYWTCQNIGDLLQWNQVESKVLDNNEIQANGIAKTTFELLYGIDGGTPNTNIASEAVSPIAARTFIKWNGNWTPAGNLGIYSGAGMTIGGAAYGVEALNNTVISYIFNTAGSNRTGQIRFTLTPTQIKMLLAKHNARGNRFIAANGAEVTELNNADFNDEVEFEIATRLYDVAQGGKPDVYIVWKYTISKLALTMNKIADYWYASNNTVAKTGVDEIHVSVPVIGETTPIQANVGLFNGDLLNTIVHNDLAVAPVNQGEWGYTVAKLENGQRAAIAGTPNLAPATGIITRLQFYNVGNTGFGGNGAFTPATAGAPAFAANTRGDVMKAASGANYLLVPQGTNLWAFRYQTAGANRNTYRDAGAQIVAQIVRRNTVANGNPNTYYEDQTVFELLNNDYAKDLVNAASHNDLANTLTGHVRANVSLACDALVQVNLTNPTFDVKFLRPVDIKGVESRIFRDATDGGNILNLVDLVQFNDWRERWNPAFGTSTANLFNTQTVGGVTGPNYQSPKWGSVTSNYYQYYQVTRIEANIAGITTDMNNGTLGQTLLSSVTANAQFENVFNQSAGSRSALMFGYRQNAAGTWIAPGGTLPAAGPANVLIAFPNTGAAGAQGVAQLKYSNNQTTVGTFKVRVPIVVTYYWGTQTTYVDLTVDNTLQN